ncbi:hypothetical protein [Paenibacillus sp. sgz500958]|uniref:hypothetical protein n=1 Tax=Paenibacillus sp. sgz500958 TaxID=3242475 RepID=UPI0036D3F484
MGSDHPLVLHKRSFILALSLLAMLIILTTQYPGPYNTADTLFHWLGIRAYSHEATRTGVNYSGIFTLILFTGCITLFNRALSRHRIIMFIAVMFLLSTTPGWLVHSYQRLAASGVYALELDPKKIDCNYAWDNNRFTVTCQIPITNYSDKAISVRPVLDIPQIYGDPMARGPVSLTELTLTPQASGAYNTTFELLTEPNGVTSGRRTGGFSLTLDDGSHTRNWE